jgi:hypothetical protein
MPAGRSKRAGNGFRIQACNVPYSKSRGGILTLVIAAVVNCDRQPDDGADDHNRVGHHVNRKSQEHAVDQEARRGADFADKQPHGDAAAGMVAQLCSNLLGNGEDQDERADPAYDVGHAANETRVASGGCLFRVLRSSAGTAGARRQLVFGKILVRKSTQSRADRRALIR